MKAKLLIYFLCLPYIIEAIFACTSEEPLCNPGNRSSAYKLKAVEAVHLEHDGSKFNLVSTDRISRTDYGILVDFELEFLQTAMNGTSDSNNAFSFIPSAFACSQPLEMYPMDTLADFTISTLQKFDASHDAGADVSELFEIVDMNSVKTLDNYVSYFASSKENQKTAFALKLTALPNNDGPFEFKLEVSLKDGRKLETTTTAIELIE